MVQVLSENRRNRLARSTQKQIEDWKEGVSFQNDSGQTISQLINNAAADRWQFAYENRHNANKLLRSKPPLYRSAISRYYYSMYHAMRACVFVVHQGDDYEQHSQLPQYIPDGFPSALNWQNMLKDARDLRNRADYEPYPKSNMTWKPDALQLKKDADLFLVRNSCLPTKQGVHIMIQLQLPIDTETIIQNRFSEAGIEIQSIERKDYPGESIFVVHTTKEDFDKAARIGNTLDLELAAQGFDGFVAVRKAEREIKSKRTRLKDGVKDPKATELANLLTVRSRTSEVQPSLSYVPDTAQNILTAITPRHHLIFGRRGTGKTALMVEAKQRVESEGCLSYWINIHTHRGEPANRIFVRISSHVCERMQVFYSEKKRSPQLLTSISRLRDDADKLLGKQEISCDEVSRLVPRMQNVIHRSADTNATRLYIFVDDLHYLSSMEQPRLLDLIHGAVRDSDAWLKVAGIRHLTSWFQPKPRLGLQTGHDADPIDLDVTLEDPSHAKKFLEAVFLRYAKHTKILSLSSILSPSALDRLVLASGAVPRDYLTLSARAISHAQTREHARRVGVQDVGKVAGDAAKIKISELEEDAASVKGATNKVIAGLHQIRRFCIDEKNCTFFRIDFRDKESQPDAYDIIRELMDLRLIHLVRASLSDIHKAGRRYEVYMLDLSQFSSERLKLRIKTLDFQKGYIVFRETGTTMEPKRGDTSIRLSNILRRGPLFELKQLSDMID